MNGLLVSVIIPVYMAERFLHRCIESVIHQTYTNWEMILVDDGSPDTSGDICDEYVRKDKRIKVIHQENQGVSAARNKGLDMAQGEWIYFLDSDDYISPKSFELLMSVQKENDYDIVASGYCNVQGKRCIVKSKNWKKLTDFEIIRKKYFVVEYSNFCTGKLVRKGLWDHIRFPVGIIFEDVFVCARLFLAAKKACVIPDPLYFYTFENVNSLANGANIFSFVNAKYGNFFAWRDREILAKEYMPAFVEICRKTAVVNAIRALMMNAGVHVIDEEKCNEMITYIKNNKDVVVSAKENWQRNILMNDRVIFLKVLGALNKYTLIYRSVVRKIKFAHISKNKGSF